MEVIHRLFANGNEAFREFLDSCSIPYRRQNSAVGDFVSLEISENDQNWPRLRSAYVAFDVLHSTRVEFSMAEIRSATWALLYPRAHTGYPQPADDFGYKSITYNSRFECHLCGIGHEQIAPFRFKTIPKSNVPRLLQLNWVFDEFFASDTARATLESSGLSGIEFYPVVHHRTSHPVPGWSQLRLQTLSCATLHAQRLNSESCPLCRRVKYHKPVGDVLKIQGDALKSTMDIVKLSEWFGSGGSAYQPVLISKRFISVLLAARVRNVQIVPVATRAQLRAA